MKNRETDKYINIHKINRQSDIRLIDNQTNFKVDRTANRQKKVRKIESKSISLFNKDDILIDEKKRLNPSVKDGLSEWRTN